MAGTRSLWRGRAVTWGVSARARCRRSSAGERRPVCHHAVVPCRQGRTARYVQQRDRESVVLSQAGLDRFQVHGWHGVFMLSRTSRAPRELCSREIEKERDRVAELPCRASRVSSSWSQWLSHTFF